LLLKKKSMLLSGVKIEKSRAVFSFLTGRDLILKTEKQVMRNCGNKLSESSESIRKGVQPARNIQQTRFTDPTSKTSDILCNADTGIGEVRQFCQLQAEGQSLTRSAMSQLQLSARAYHRILKLARTIADLANSENI
jgi:predicted ATPase with chaperone activity